MAQLSGRKFVSRILQLEVVSDDAKHVLVITRDDSPSGLTKLTVRKAWESLWGSDGPVFTLEPTQLGTIGMALSGADASWDVESVKRVKYDSFMADDPDPKPDPNRPDCSQLDIERAKAANMTEQAALIKAEMVLDHSRDKHVTGDVTGCPSCENKHITPALGGSDDRPKPEPFDYRYTPSDHLVGDDDDPENAGNTRYRPGLICDRCATHSFERTEIESGVCFCGGRINETRY